MILLADSGSTKTDWIFLSNNQVVHRQETKGLNPNFVSKTFFLEQIQGLAHLERVHEIYFYGAGCSTDLAKNQVKSYCKDVFTNANQLVIDHDLMAACIAAAGNESGIVGILGTGSNSCVYHKGSILSCVGSHGYLLGDEGGGVHLGRIFLEKYLRKKLPIEVLNIIHISENEILENVYKTEGVQAYLASFARYVIENKKQYWAKSIIEECFQLYFDHQISFYQNHEYKVMYMVGSIAELLKEEFAQVASRNGYQVGNVVQKPIEGLIEYFTKSHAKNNGAGF
jgi:glucosamine kinase